MYAEFRQDVFGTLAVELADVPLWDVIPDDVSELPCVVVGRPGGVQTSVAVVFDLTLQVFILGRRQQAGGSEQELTVLLDRVFLALGGSRGTKSPSGETIAVTRVLPRVIPVAGLDISAFTLEVESSATTCG